MRVAGRRSAKIATRKGKSDAIKAKLYGRYGKRIQQVARTGADPSANPALADLMDEAKGAGVPRDIIDRNVAKASEGAAADFKEAVYEAYGAGGTGFIIECLTDNVNRSVADVKMAITKAGGKWAESGSVAFNFTKKGVVTVTGVADEDTLYELEGLEDVVGLEEEGGAYKLVAELVDYKTLRQAVGGADLTTDPERSGVVMLPGAPVEVSEEDFEKCEKLVERLLECQDVDAVYSNCAGLD